MSRDVATNQDVHRSHKEYHLAIYSSLLIKETEPSGCLHQTEKRAPEKVPLMEWMENDELSCLHSFGNYLAELFIATFRW